MKSEVFSIKELSSVDSGIYAYLITGYSNGSDMRAASIVSGKLVRVIP